MKTLNILYLLMAFTILSCASSTTKTIYFSISFESTTNFPQETQTTSQSIARVDYFEDRVVVDVIRNDSICSNKVFEIKNDTIYGNWYTIEDYTYRLLFPELILKARDKNNRPHESEIIEIKNEQEWKMYKEWGIGLRSHISGQVQVNEKTIILKTSSTINTPARVFSGNSKTIIEETDGSKVIKFDSIWQECMARVD